MIKIQCSKCKKFLLRQRNRIDATCYGCFLKRSKLNYYQNRNKKIKQAKNYRLKNKEIIKKKKRLNYLLKREEIIKKVKEHYIKNKQRILKQKAKYRKENIQKILIKNKNRIHLLRSFAKITDITNKYLERILSETIYCPMCHKKIVLRSEKHIDHIIPLNVGGFHIKSNIRIICKKCNLSRPKDGKDNENSK